MEPRPPSKIKVPSTGLMERYGVLKPGLTFLLILLLLLSVVVYVVLRSGYNPYASKTSYFTVVVDCGSTGTRVSVYEWMLRGGLSDHDLPMLVHSYPGSLSNDDLSRKDRCQYHCMQTEPGLDKFVGNSSEVRASLEPLIVWAERWVPPERHADTPIFVLATAGLRKLSSKDAGQVLEDVEAVVKDHAFLYRKSWIRVLTGKEEAYYGWVALNYRMGSFNMSTSLPTLGLLDLGGSSLQVVAEIDESEEDESVIRSKIGSLEHRILAYSWPAFGLNEAFDKTIVLLSHLQALKENNMGTLEVNHPCLGSSFMQNYTCKGCFGISSKDSESFHSQVQNMLLVGEPNWEQCKLLARAAAVNSSSSDRLWLTDSSKSQGGWAPLSDSRTLNLKAVTHRVARFHALSGFFAVYTTLNLSPQSNLTKIWEKGKQLCSRSWAGMSNIPRNQKYAAQYCFRVPYVTSLIEDALCLGDKDITFGPGDVSWTLGAALVEGEFLWLSSKDQTNIRTQKNTGLISSSIFLFIVLVFLLLIVYRCQAKLPMPSKKVAAVGVSLPSFICPKRRP